jgi:putative two-component system response regulator
MQRRSKVAMTEESIASVYEKETQASFTDNLTGVYNHGFFLVTLEREIHRCRRQWRPLSLAMVDMDEFALRNVRMGVMACDRILKDVAGVIQSIVRSADLVARYSGDRFAVVLLEAGPSEAREVGERIRAAVASFTGADPTVSVGLSSLTEGVAASRDELIREAFDALKEAKLRGKNRTCVFKPNGSHPGVDVQRILVVDDDALNQKLMEGLLLPHGYDVHKVASGSEALYIMAREDIDLVLLDVMMPGMDGFEVCRAIKADAETRMTPVILITALDDVETKIRGIEAGADDFITKPPNREELTARVKSLLKLKKLNGNLTSMENVLFSLAKSVEAKDRYTQDHVDRVCELAVAIGKEMRMSTGDLEALRFGATLHDIGKMGIPEGILNKPGPLDERERAVIETHPDIGHRICLPLKKNLGAALEVVRHHHEKLDGSGYPDGLVGEAIPMVARIVAVADIFDALRTDRPYRGALPLERALGILNEEVSQGKLDRDVVKRLIGLVLTEKPHCAGLR